MKAKGRKPRRAEKDILSDNHLSPKNWNVIKHTSDVMKAINKKTQSKVELDLR